jgi:hypothetical protein
VILTTPILLGADAPRVLTVPMIAAILADRRKLPARHSVFKWIREQVAGGMLQPVTRGLYLNLMASPRPSAADAAAFIRSGAVVSLQTVLGEAGVTNNYSDIVTSVVSHGASYRPSVRPVRAGRMEFRFHALPDRLVDARAGAPEDRLDSEAKHTRSTPEKALLDWIYLGESPRTKIARPPLDTDLDRIDKRRLRRLAKAMGLIRPLNSYLERKRLHDQNPS